MLTFYFILGLIAFLALLTFAFWCVYKAGGQDEYERGRTDAYNKIGKDREQERAEWAGPRHAKSQPRADLPLQPAAATSSAPEPTRDPWFTPGAVRLPIGGAIGVFLGQQAAKVKDIKTTLLADPDPAPALNGAADTGTMAKIRLPSGTTDTGELRAVESIGDAMVQRIENGELV